MKIYTFLLVVSMAKLFAFDANGKDVTINVENSGNEFETLVLQNEIKGTVTDPNGAPVPGVNIILQGTSIGAQSDFDGIFSIQANKGDVLEFSFLGMKSQTITVGDANTINVVMQEDAESLGEVVVTAFGLVREKKSITYAAQTVETGDLKSARALNVTSSLSGKVAGISVTQGANGVGSPTRVVLRCNRYNKGKNHGYWFRNKGF